MNSPTKISEIIDPVERMGRWYTEQFWMITNLAFLKYLKVPPSEQSIKMHNSACEFLELPKRLQINPETLNYYMDDEE